MKQTVEQRSIEKWGEAAKGGFQILPDILLKKQVDLGLLPLDVLVLINVAMHWWYADQKPFPRTTTIAARMGVEPRTVQRSMKKLIDLQLITRQKELMPDGTERVVVDLSGLVTRLEQYVRSDADYIARTAHERKTRQGLVSSQDVTL
jgi:predicted transcriptional regulator